MDRRHAALLRAVDVDVEVVADEEHLLELDAKRFPQRLENRSLRFTLAVLVREDHRVEGDAEAIEDLAEGVAGSAAGVADQSQRVPARLQLANDIECAGNSGRKKI